MKKNLTFWLWNDILEPAEICRQIDDMKEHGFDGFFIHPMPDEFRKNDFGGGMKGYLTDEYFAMFKIALEHGKKNNMQVWIYDEGGWPSGTVNGQIVEKYPHLRMHRIFADGTIAEYPKRPDLLNPETTRIFIEMVHEKYKKHFGADFGKAIPGVFTDEPFFGAFNPPYDLPWSPVLAENFRRIKNYDIGECLEKIFRDNDPHARQDYAEVWGESICSGYLEILHRWCNENGLLFTGHFNGDDTPEAMFRHLGANIFKLQQHFDIPGCDVIWRQIHPLLPESDFTRVSVSASGNKPTISETFGVYGYDNSLAEMKFVANMQFIGGLKILMPMGIHYSTRHARLVTTISHIAGADPRWEKFALYNSYQRRMSMVVSNAVPVIKARLPFPVGKLQSGLQENNSAIFPEALKFAEKQITYEYSPDTGNIPENLIPDIQLTSPCPALRTRHLRAPRTERRLLVNSKIEPITFSFKAPEGYNVWFDPATGFRKTAVPDEKGVLTLTLGFAGAMVLITLPGKMPLPKTPPPEKQSRQDLKFTFSKVVKAIDFSEEGLTEVPAPEHPGEDFCGTLRYKAEFFADRDMDAEIIFPAAQRAMLTLSVNGKNAGSKVWTPYCWQLKLAAGKNIIEADLSTTPGKLLDSGRFRKYLEELNCQNPYLQRYDEYEKFLPDERPLEDAFIKY